MEYSKLSEEELRAHAKEKKIRYWHNKNKMKLIKELEQLDKHITVGKANVLETPNLPWGYIMDSLDPTAMSQLGDMLDALNTLSKPGVDKFVDWSTAYFVDVRNTEFPIENLRLLYGRQNGMISESRWVKLLTALCAVYRGRGWRLVDDMLQVQGKPLFSLRWHVDTWHQSKRANIDVTAARMLSILMTAPVAGDREE